MSQGNFDFQTFNNLTANIPAGLQVFLAQQLMSNAAWTYARYDNARQDQAMEILSEIKALRTLLKQDAADRAKTASV